MGACVGIALERWWRVTTLLSRGCWCCGCSGPGTGTGANRFYPAPDPDPESLRRYQVGQLRCIMIPDPAPGSPSLVRGAECPLGTPPGGNHVLAFSFCLLPFSWIGYAFVARPVVGDRTACPQQGPLRPAVRRTTPRTRGPSREKAPRRRPERSKEARDSPPHPPPPGDPTPAPSPRSPTTAQAPPPARPRLRHGSPPPGPPSRGACGGEPRWCWRSLILVLGSPAASSSTTLSRCGGARGPPFPLAASMWGRLRGLPARRIFHRDHPHPGHAEPAIASTGTLSPSLVAATSVESQGLWVASSSTSVPRAAALALLLSRAPEECGGAL